MPGQRGPFDFDRNVHFINGNNDEIGGAWQNGSLSWAEMSEWMQIVFELPLEKYALFPCLEIGDPENPVTQHGAPINIHANADIIQPGFYVLLSSQGKDSSISLIFVIKINKVLGSVIDIPINPENPVPRSVTRSLSNPDPRVSEPFLL